MGDSFINAAHAKNKSMPTLRHAQDKRIDLKTLEKYWGGVNSLINEIRQKTMPKSFVIVLAADSYQVAIQARKFLKYEVVENPGMAIHSNNWNKGSDVDALKIVADLYCLALATVLLSPTDSTFSRTANDLGM